jgi:cobalt-zinc-cadmium efflux system membrane fusion protein
MAHPQGPSRARSLPRGRQIALLVVAGVVAIGLILGLPLLKELFAPKAPSAPPTPPSGSFYATREQWAGLKFAPAEMVSFDASAQTDGKIAASDERTTQVFSPLSGHVSRVFVKLGDQVKRGQPLFSVSAAEVAQGQQDVAIALAQVKQTEAAEARQKALYKANGAALKDVQQSETDLATAQAQLASARNRLRVLGVGEDQIGHIERQGAAGATAADAVVVSPLDGVVIQKSVGLGQNIASISLNGSATPAMTVSDLADVWLVGNLREVDAPKARRGQKVEVQVGALPGRTFTGVVDFVAPTVDPTTRRVTVRADIANPSGELKPEMFASFKLLTGAASQAIGVPADAVVFEGEAAHVWVAGANRTLSLRQIVAGRSQDGMIEVISGLKPGETVVVSGSLFIDRAAQGD